MRSRASEKKRRLPSIARALAGVTVTLRFALPSANSRATLRQSVPSSRSRLRTPASRVYSRITMSITSSLISICSGVSPLRSIWRGTR